MRRSGLRILISGGVASTCVWVFLSLGALASVPADESALTPPSGGQRDSGALAASATLTANCRYGFSMSGGESYLAWLGEQNTGVGWYLNFNTMNSANIVPGAEFVQVIRVLQDRDVNGTYLPTFSVYPPLTEGGLGTMIKNNPGSLWLAGNEPDRGPNVPTDTNRVQDDTFPDVYAKAYHDIYHFVKARDAKAQVGVAGLVQVTPGRLKYLDLMWQAYTTTYGVNMPVDVWNMHIYVLPEANYEGTAPNEVASVAKGTPLSLAKREGLYSTTPEAQALCDDPAYTCVHDHGSMLEFQAQVIAMRNWMKSKGQRNKPLILSEFGILYPNNYDPHPDNPAHCWVFDEFGQCFTQARVSQFLRDTFDYLNSAADPSTGYPLDGNRLVQQWLWFDAHRNLGELGSVANIVTATTPLTFSPVGKAYEARVSNAFNYPQFVNLSGTSTSGMFVVGGSESNTVTVSVGAYNLGTIVPANPVTITAYADPARTQVLGHGFLTGARGCARQEHLTTVSWGVPLTQSGAMSYWLTINPGNLAGETTMTDNNLNGTVFVGNKFILLPAILR